jgi:nucleotide-binding universal stress UspA family protein
MRVVFCLDGPTASMVRVLADARVTLRLETAEITLLHVVDSGPRHLVDLPRARPGRPPLPPERRRSLDAAERERAEEVLAAARDALRPDLPHAAFSSQVLAGRPEQEIVRYLDRVAANVVVLGARPGAPAGPASIGHVARFVLDHARCSVLLVR